MCEEAESGRDRGGVRWDLDGRTLVACRSRRRDKGRDEKSKSEGQSQPARTPQLLPNIVARADFLVPPRPFYLHFPLQNSSKQLVQTPSTQPCNNTRVGFRSREEDGTARLAPTESGTTGSNGAGPTLPSPHHHPPITRQPASMDYESLIDAYRMTGRVSRISRVSRTCVWPG